ncbi:KRAB [Mytilus coruscus]|uniref:KRAB n=1 Tax=Mytilus coruscus TaxID=42192 RepID=A0A6J8CM88_MYTCO|nr:KRAB [Mytilus coruscus]
MALIKDCESYIIKDPEYYEITEDEIPIEDEITVNENCARLFYHVKQENINSKYIVHTVQASEEPDIYDIDNQTPPDYDRRDFIATNRKDVKKYRRRRLGGDISFRKLSYKHTMIQNQLSHVAEKVKRKKKMSEHKKKKYHELGTQIKQPTTDKTWECEIFLKTFSSRSNLKRHMAVHSVEPVSNRPFKCEICGKTFGKRSNFKSHAKTHNCDIKEDNKFRCKVCGKQESNKRNFDNHMRVHTGERPFQCDLCHLSFKQKSALRRHDSVHTGEFLNKGKPIQCEICGRYFGQSQQLTRHMKCHNPSTKREYKCDHCPKEFSEKHHLLGVSRSRPASTSATTPALSLHRQQCHAPSKALFTASSSQACKDPVSALTEVVILLRV